MGLGKTVLIIVILLAAFWYVAPEQFNDGKEEVLSFLNLGSTEDVGTSGTRSLRDILLGSQSEEEIESNIPPKDTSSENITKIDESDPCTWPNYGYPDFYGTVYEGDNCVNSGKDIKSVCLENPPLNYEGSISIIRETSDPEMGCCVENGYCYWRD
jgi:hypothetical protein